MFLKILLDIKDQKIPEDFFWLPKKYDLSTLKDRYAVVVFHMLDSLKKNNIKRLLERS